MAGRTSFLGRLVHPRAGSGTPGSAAPGSADDEEPSGAAWRSETLQRLQIGVGGLVAMLLLVMLASVIEQRADLAEARSVPEAAATVAPSAAAPQNDPLVSAGVVPDLPASEASASGAARPAPARSPAAAPAR